MDADGSRVSRVGSGLNIRGGRREKSRGAGAISGRGRARTVLATDILAPPEAPRGLRHEHGGLAGSELSRRGHGQRRTSSSEAALLDSLAEIRSR